MIIGLTGLIGSGKSEVAAVFAGLGAELISGDELGREAVEEDSVVFYRLLMEFGPGILRPDKTLDRGRLGRLAFSTPEKTELLNGIVHPALLERLDLRLNHAREGRYHAVVDAALLVYWGYHIKMDYTVLVSSTGARRFERLVARGLSEEDIRRRNASQLPLTHLRQCSDAVITNNGDLSSLREKARKMYLWLIERG